MIDGLKWKLFTASLSIILLTLFSTHTYAAVEKEVEEDKARPSQIGEPDGPDSSTRATAPNNNGGIGKIADGFIVPEKKNLAELIGSSEIPVLADVEGEFIKSMVEYQLIEGESISQVGKTDLVESISVGRSFNRESLAALARTEQAEAQTDQAYGLMLPSISMRVSSGKETSEPSVVVNEETGELVEVDTHTRTDAALTIRQPLFNLPIFLDWRRRKVREEAREENYRASDGDAYISMVSTYLSLISSRLQADITLDFEDQLDELLNYIEKRAGAGAASVSDMSRVRARSQETISNRLEQESAHAAAGIEFVRLTNIAPKRVRLPVLKDIGVSLLPKSFKMAVATAIEFNPEITELAAELEAAKIDRSVAKSRYLPKIDAEYTDTYSLHAGGDPDSDGQRDKRLMMVMNWELFSGGRDYKTHAERTARHQELLYRLDDQRRRVIQALSANYSTLAATRERINSGYRELESISTAAEAMSKRMLSGNQSLLDLLTVYDRYYKVRSRLINLHILEMNTVAQLVRLTIGTPWASSIETEVQGKDRDKTFPIFEDNRPFWDIFIGNKPIVTSNLRKKGTGDEGMPAPVEIAN